MVRPLRIQIRDGWYHVTAHETLRQMIFTEEASYRHFLELLKEIIQTLFACYSPARVRIQHA
ncbi:MAG: hypothetical protein M5U15_11110 [Kiritimatiellae bacterium]|nr:hypothetical protein [Kiritimatiellia bacterium]